MSPTLSSSPAAAPAVARPTRPLARTLPALLIAALLAGCQTPINTLRANRLGGTATPAPVTVEPRALALGLQAAAEGPGLTSDSLRATNALLTNQGRLSSQVLSITPFNTRGEQLAQRLARALERNGAQPPRIEPMPAPGARLSEAARSGWDLELQSEALVVVAADCRIANPGDWAIHPFDGVGPLGCANRANLARMVGDSRDLLRPRALGPADGKAASLAVDRYQTGNLRELLDIDFDN